MISNKEAKAFLSKDNYYKVTKRDVESFQKILSKAPKTLYNGDLIGKIVYISYGDYDDISSIFKNYIGFDDPFSFIDPDRSEYTEGRLDDNTYNYPKISFKAHSLQDANYFQDIIPTIIYLSKRDIKNFKEGKEINLDFRDFMSSFEETNQITEEISRFVKKIRKDIEFMTNNETYEQYEKESYDNFIEELMIYSSKTPMLGNRRQQDVKFIKKLLKDRNKVGSYHLHRICITKDEFSKLIAKCCKGEDK